MGTSPGLGLIFTHGTDLLEQFIPPIVLVVFCLIAAGGLALALPRRQGEGIPNLVPIGAVLLAGAFGLAAVALGMKAGENGPGIFFYVFAAIGLGSGVRMVTHPRPVYSALYFIMTIVASCGMYLLLGAEFMAFALVIIYAGAILITYLFVIMLATQAPTGNDLSDLDDTDAVAREPVVGAALGFVLMGLISVMLFTGIGSLPAPSATDADAVLASMPRKVDRAFREAGLIEPEERVVRLESGLAAIDTIERTAMIENTELGTTRELPEGAWPEDFRATNMDRLGMNLLRDHPMTIEIAGVILLMAMLGATVLARKQVDLEESLKEAQARKLGVSMGGATDGGGSMDGGGR